MRLMLILATISISYASAAAEVERPGVKPSCPVYRLAAPPAIDGEVRNDPAWLAIPGITGFCVLGGGYTVAKQSTVQIGWTAAALYFAMDCEEPDLKLIDDKRKDGGQLWLDNGVEVFLQFPRSSDVFQFIVNTAGARVVGAGRDKVKLGDWRAAAVKGQDFWSLEAEIPFACLGATPSPGSKWHGAFCRNIWEYTSGGDKFTTWPPLTDRFREPENFAALEFRGDSLSPERAAQAALKLNLPYRQHLSQQIEELAQTGRQYEAPIAEAATERMFASEARELNGAWKQIMTLAGGSANAPLPEVRKFITMASDLTRRSYELKYRFLIEQLLAE